MAEDSPQPETSPRSTVAAARRRRLLGALGVLLLLLLALRAALPWALARLAERAGSAALARTVTIDDLDLSLAGRRVAVEGVRVGAPNDPAAAGSPADEGALLELERAEVQLALRPLLRSELHLVAAFVQSPTLRLGLEPDGRLSSLGADAPDTDAAETAGWTFRLDALDLRDAAIALIDAEPGPPALELGLPSLSLAELAIADGETSLGDLHLDRPRLRSRREVLRGLAAGDAAAEPAGEGARSVDPAAAESARVHIGALALEAARITVVGEAEESVVEADLVVREASFAPGARFPAELALRLEDGRIEVAGDVGVDPPFFDGSLRWSQLDFPVLGRALGLDLPLEVESILSSGDLRGRLVGGPEHPALELVGSTRAEDVRLRHAPSGARIALASGTLVADELRAAKLGGDEPVRLTGGLRLEGLEVEAASQGIVAQIGRVEVREGQLSLPTTASGGPLRVRLGDVRVAAPRVVYTRRPVPGRAATPGAAGAAAAGDATADPELVVDRLELAEGAISFVDETVQPPHRSQIRDLSLRARDLRGPKRPGGTVALRATRQGGARLRADASLAKGSGRAEIDLASLALPAFAGYAAQGGYDLDDGLGFLGLEVQLDGERIDANGLITLAHLDLSSQGNGRFRNTFGVPLDLALALLRDGSGEIRLPLAFETRRNGLRAELAPLVAGALRQAVVGAMAVPLKSLKGISRLAKGRTDLPVLANGPGDAGLRPGTEEEVDTLAALLESRPALGLSLRGRAGPDDDLPLALALLQQRVQDGEQIAGLEDQGRFARRRIRRAVAESGPDAPKRLSGEERELLLRVAAELEVPDPLRQELALARSRAVREALVVERGVAPERVAVGEPGRGAPGVVPQLVPMKRLAQAPRETTPAAPAH